MVRREGIEPPLPVPKTGALSVKLTARGLSRSVARFSHFDHGECFFARSDAINSFLLFRIRRPLFYNARMSNSPIAILGAGNMASALALHFARQGRSVRLYCIEPDVEDAINRKHCNPKYLKGHRFPKHIAASNDIQAVLKNATTVFVAVPSHAMKEVLITARPFLSSKAIVASITKGLNPKTLEPLIYSETTTLPAALQKRICFIGGPAIATEIAKGSPTGLIIAGKNRKSVLHLKHLLQTETIKCATTHDLLGVGLASALKNPYAIALGMCDGLKYPTNAKALVFTIAIDEMAQLLKKAGANSETIRGLAGLGDLLTTSMSPHGRNRSYGERLVGAKTKDPKKLKIGIVEGISTTATAVKLSKALKVQTPLLSSVDRCLKRKSGFEKPFLEYLKQLKLS